jgi:MFS family permease
MIPCSKLTDRWGRKRCFIWGLALYGVGALTSAVSPNLGVLILGNSVFEGVGTALLIPPTTCSLRSSWRSEPSSWWRSSSSSAPGSVRGRRRCSPPGSIRPADVDRRRVRRHHRRIALLLVLVRATDSIWAFVPGLALVGLGLGGMLTPSVNVVQSSFPEQLQGEISGLSRSISNLGSSFGTAIAGTILVSVVATGNRAYAWAMATLIVFGLVGLGAALLLPAKVRRHQA